MWVARCHFPANNQSRIHAYSMVSMARVPSRDIDSHAAGNTCPTGIWSDGTTLFSVDRLDRKVFTYALPPPTQPQRPSVDLITNDETLTVVWTPPADDGGRTPTDYTVAYKESNEEDIEVNWADVPHSNLAELSVDIANLAIGTFYDVRVRATNEAGNGPWEIVTTTPASAFHPAPQRFSLRYLGPTGSQCTWRRPLTRGISGWLHAMSTKSSPTTTRLAYGNPDADIGVIFGTRGTDANIEDALTHPRGLWSDGVHLWVVEDYTLDNSFPYDRVTAYKLSDSTPREGYIDPWSAGHYDPFGVWGGESTVWVSDTGRDRIYAYNRTTRARQPEHDFKTLYAAGLRDPKGIWSDGSTMWVADSTNHNTKIYAFSVDTKQRVHERDINARFKDSTSEESDGIAKVTRHRGLWGNTQDNIMWVVGWVSGNQKLYPFDIPPAVAPQPPAESGGGAKPRSAAASVVEAGQMTAVLKSRPSKSTTSSARPGTRGGLRCRTVISTTFRCRSETWTTACPMICGSEARNSVDWGEYDETSGTPSLPKPLVPRNLRAASGDQVLSVSWDPPVNVNDAPVTDYDVKYQGPGEQPQNVAHTGGLSDLKVSITPVTNGVTYRVQVQAMERCRLRAVGDSVRCAFRGLRNARRGQRIQRWNLVGRNYALVG